MLTELKRTHFDGYHNNAIEKMRLAKEIGDDEQYAYWYGMAIGIELSVEIAGGLAEREILILHRIEAGFDSAQSPVREI